MGGKRNMVSGKISKISFKKSCPIKENQLEHAKRISHLREIAPTLKSLVKCNINVTDDVTKNIIQINKHLLSYKYW